MNLMTKPTLPTFGPAAPAATNVISITKGARMRGETTIKATEDYRIVMIDEAGEEHDFGHSYTFEDANIVAKRFRETFPECRYEVRKPSPSNGGDRASKVTASPVEEHETRDEAVQKFMEAFIAVGQEVAAKGGDMEQCVVHCGRIRGRRSVQAVAGEVKSEVRYF